MIFSRSMRQLDFNDAGLQRGLNFLRVVEGLVGGLSEEQHPHRRWEYALAYEALKDSLPSILKINQTLKVADFGAGFGLLSPMMVQLGHHVSLYEIWTHGNREDLVRKQLAGAAAPDANYSIIHRPLSQLVPKLDHGVYDASFCISVLEHVKEEKAAFVDLCRSVRPGGLVFLTMDFANTDQDTFRHRGMRARIYDAKGMERLVGYARGEGLELLGGESDWSWHGPMVNEYSFSSLALVKQS